MSKCSELIRRSIENISIVYMAIIFILITYYERNLIPCLLAALAVIAYALTFLIRSQASQQVHLINCSLMCLILSGDWITKIELMGFIYSIQATKFQKSGILSSLTSLCIMEFQFIYILVCDETRNLPCHIIPLIQLVVQSLLVLQDIREMRKSEEQKYEVPTFTFQTFTQRSQTLVSTLDKHIKDKCPYLVAQIKPMPDGSGLQLYEANNNLSQYLIEKSMDINQLFKKLDLKINGRKENSLFTYIMSKNNYIFNEISLTDVKIQQFQRAQSSSRVNLLRYIKDPNVTENSQKAVSTLDEAKNKLKHLKTNHNEIYTEQILCLFRGETKLEAHYITLIWEHQALFIWINVLPVEDSAERFICIQRELYKLPYLDDNFKEIGFLENFFASQSKKIKKIYKLASSLRRFTSDSNIKTRDQAIGRLQDHIQASLMIVGNNNCNLQNAINGVEGDQSQKFDIFKSFTRITSMQSNNQSYKKYNITFSHHQQGNEDIPNDLMVYNQKRKVKQLFLNMLEFMRQLIRKSPSRKKEKKWHVKIMYQTLSTEVVIEILVNSISYPDIFRENPSNQIILESRPAFLFFSLLNFSTNVGSLLSIQFKDKDNGDLIIELRIAIDQPTLNPQMKILLTPTQDQSFSVNIYNSLYQDPTLQKSKTIN